MKKNIAYILTFSLFVTVINSQAPDAPSAPPGAPPAPPGAPGAPGAPEVPGTGPNLSVITVVSQSEIDQWPEGTQVKIGTVFKDKKMVKPEQIKGSTVIKLPSGKEIRPKTTAYEEWAKAGFSDVQAAQTNGNAADSTATKEQPAAEKPAPSALNIELERKARAQRIKNEFDSLKQSFSEFLKQNDVKTRDVKKRVDSFDKIETSFKYFSENKLKEEFMAKAKNNLPDEINTLDKLNKWVLTYKKNIEEEREELIKKLKAAADLVARQAALKEIKDILKKSQALGELTIGKVEELEKYIGSLKKISIILKPEDFANLTSTIKSKALFNNWIDEQNEKIKLFRIKHPKKMGASSGAGAEPKPSLSLKDELAKKLAKPKVGASSKESNHRSLGSLNIELNSLKSLSM